MFDRSLICPHIGSTCNHTTIWSSWWWLDFAIYETHFLQNVTKYFTVLLPQAIPAPLPSLWSSQIWFSKLLKLGIQSALVIESKCLVLSGIGKKHTLHPKLNLSTWKHIETREKLVAPYNHLDETTLSKSKNIYL